jgi:hypothetical protein
MRVLVVSANQERSPDPVAPLGACYVATAAAAAGHDVRLLDLCFSTDVERDVTAAVGEHRPEVIGVSLRNVDNCAWPDTVSYLPHYQRVVAACRAASEAPVVLGGSAFTTMPAFYLPALRAPYGVVGEGEAAFPALLARLAAGEDGRGLPGVAAWDAAGRAVTIAPPAWLPSVDRVRADRRWIDNRAYFEQGGMANLQTKRGCHYKCTFCAYPVIEGRGMRTRDPEGIAAEVRALLDAHGIDQFFVVDSVFNAPRGHAERVCEALRPLGRHIRWSCFVTPGNFGAELLGLMQAAGCQSIDFGTDAAADATLRGFRKSFNVHDIRAASAPRGHALLPQPRLRRRGRDLGDGGRDDRRHGRVPADGRDRDVRRARVSRDPDRPGAAGTRRGGASGRALRALLLHRPRGAGRASRGGARRGAGAGQLAPPRHEGERRGAAARAAPRPRTEGRPLALREPAPPRDGARGAGCGALRFAPAP